MRTLIAVAAALAAGYLGMIFTGLGPGAGGPLGADPVRVAGGLLAGGLAVGVVAGERWWLAALCAWPALLAVAVSLGGDLLGGAADTPAPALHLVASALVALAGGWMGQWLGVRLGFE